MNKGRTHMFGFLFFFLVARNKKSTHHNSSCDLSSLTFFSLPPPPTVHQPLSHSLPLGEGGEGGVWRGEPISATSLQLLFGLFGGGGEKEQNKRKRRALDST
jgi:hypothetical protein